VAWSQRICGILNNFKGKVVFFETDGIRERKKRTKGIGKEKGKKK